MEEVRLDLFKLHDGNDKGHAIKVILNPNLEGTLRNMIDEIKTIKHLSTDELIKHLRISLAMYYQDLQHSRFRLYAIKNLIRLWGCTLGKTRKDIKLKNYEIQDLIEDLVCGKGNAIAKAKAPKVLNENLCKMTGAIIGDGNLYTAENEGWKMAIDDLYKDNLDRFSEWLEQEFGMVQIPKLHKKERCWRIMFSNKIIFNYLNRILQIPAGKKSHIVSVPKIIKSKSLSYRKAFAIGFLMFECGIGNYRSYVGVGTKSYFLFRDLKIILKKFGITPDIESKVPLYQLFIWNKDKLKRFNDLFFEMGSLKHRKLKLHLGEDKLNGKSINDIEQELDYLFPKRENVVHFNTVIELLKTNKLMSGKELQLKLDRDRRNVSEILNKLNKWDVLIFEKQKDNQKLWSLNPNLKRN